MRALLGSRVSFYSLRAEDYLSALVGVASRFKIPMEIEWVRNPDTLRKVSLSWRQVTVQRIVDNAVASASGYRWNIENGVLNVYRSDLLRDNRNFMIITIEDYSVRSEYAGVAGRDLQTLLNRREIPPPRSASGLRLAHGTAGSTFIGQGDQPMTITLHNATVRQILRHFIQDTGFKVNIITLDPRAPSYAGWSLAHNGSDNRTWRNRQQGSAHLGGADVGPTTILTGVIDLTTLEPSLSRKSEIRRSAAFGPQPKPHSKFKTTPSGR